eukprot:Rmarinus@m.15101
MALAASRNVVVRLLEAERKIIISLLLPNGKERNLNRSMDEIVEKCLIRLTKSVGGQSVTLTDDSGNQIPQDRMNSTAWKHGGSLAIDESVYKILVNPPYLENIALDEWPMRGYPVHATVTGMFVDRYLWRWFRCFDRDFHKKEIVSHEEFYVPTMNDLNSYIGVECIPVRTSNCSPPGSDVHGGSMTAISKTVVRDAPQPEKLLSGHRESARIPQESFRVMTYNILADMYATTNFAKTVLYPYVSEECLDIRYRRQLLLAEIAHFQPDILCMQEVGQKLFKSYLVPHLARLGLAGSFYTPKNDQVGLATFFRSQVFDAVEARALQVGTPYRENALPSSIAQPPFSQGDLVVDYEPLSRWPLQDVISDYPNTRRHLPGVRTAAQFLILRRKRTPEHPPLPRSTPSTGTARHDNTASTVSSEGPPLSPLQPLAPGQETANGERVCVSNTHLYYHPHAPHIRVLQAARIAEEANEMIKRHAERNSLTVPPSMVSCGDFNCTHNTAGTTLMTHGSVSPSHHSWKYLFAAERENPFDDSDVSEEGGGDTSAPSPCEAESTLPPDATAATNIELSEKDPSDTGHKQLSECADAALRADFDPRLSVSVPFRFLNAAHFPFTNYVRGFVEQLDYIYAEAGRLEVTGCVAMPEEDLIRTHTALPSPVAPSDHLPVVVDLRSL